MVFDTQFPELVNQNMKRERESLVPLTILFRKTTGPDVTWSFGMELSA